MKKKRLDLLLLEKGLADSRSQAQRLIMAGQVKAAGQVIYKPSTMIEGDPELSLVESPRYVSRGAEKLEGALEYFKMTNLEGYVCADVGASTGGFTDCLLSYGAKKVYAIDVGQNILHWKLRTDERVVVMEQTNARYLDMLPEKVDLVVIDVSFISLDKILPVTKNWLKQSGGRIIALVKPQFEAGRKEAARGKGVIRDVSIHQQVLKRVVESAQSEGYSVKDLLTSPLLGPKGNMEFLLLLEYPESGGIDTDEVIGKTLGIELE